jgi:hypothetical protein
MDVVQEQFCTAALKAETTEGGKARRPFLTAGSNPVGGLQLRFSLFADSNNGLHLRVK